jgi:hypothetical protein
MTYVQYDLKPRFLRVIDMFFVFFYTVLTTRLVCSPDLKNSENGVGATESVVLGLTFHNN